MPDDVIVGRFAETLKSLRISAGLSQGALAERCGLATSAISMIESGAREPMLSTAEMISEALGVSVSEMLWQEDFDHTSREFCIQFSELMDLDDHDRALMMSVAKRLRR